VLYKWTATVETYDAHHAPRLDVCQNLKQGDSCYWCEGALKESSGSQVYYFTGSAVPNVTEGYTGVACPTCCQ
jgi:hypothetical protein